MGMNDFAPFVPRNQSFVVRNIGINPKKTIKIFNYPINYLQTRDLLRIPGVSEADIRASLLKGTLRNKILNSEIEVIESDIDLLQFNLGQKTFLQGAGIVHGLDVTDQITGALTAAQHQTLRQLVHFIDNGPGDGFATGAYRTTSPAGNPFPTSIVWWIDNSQTQKIVEKLIAYDSNQVPSTITWHAYQEDGITIAHTIVDTITYTNNVFETTRTRSIL